ncbi:MAG: hypothetical protein AAF734_06010, partial [Bacteroidota bacterium]
DFIALEVAISEDVAAVCSYFGYESEIKYINQQRLIRDFLKRIYQKGLIDHFRIQFESYKTYKKKSAEKVHSFQSFIGTHGGEFLDGGWNSHNWEKKLNEYQPKLTHHEKRPKEKFNPEDYYKGSEDFRINYKLLEQLEKEEEMAVQRAS